MKLIKGIGMVYGRRRGIYDVHNTEPEAIFKACEYILKETTN